MRSHEGRIAVHDAINAAEWIMARVAGVTFEGFVGDEVLRAAVERKLGIVGEALWRADRVEGGLEDAVPQLRKAIGLRNILAHGYDSVKAEVVYAVAVSHLPELVANLRMLPGMKDAE